MASSSTRPNLSLHLSDIQSKVSSLAAAKDSGADLYTSSDPRIQTLGELLQLLQPRHTGKRVDISCRNQTLLDLHKDLLALTGVQPSGSSSRRSGTEWWADETTETSLVASVLGRIVTNNGEEEVAEVKNAAISW